MAIAYVKDTGRVTASAVDSSAGSFGSLPSAGNFIGVSVCVWNGASPNTPAPTDNQSNTYSRSVQSPASNGANSSIHHAGNIGSPTGTFTITVDPDGTGLYMEWIGTEFSDVATTTPEDVTASSSGNDAAPTSGTTATTAQADELVLAVVALSQSSVNVNVSSPASTGYTSLAVNQNANATIGCEASYKVVSATGTQVANWTADSGAWSACVATYKAAAGGGGQTITGALYSDTDTFGAGTVTPGAVAITGTAYSDADTFGAGTVSLSGSPQTITGALYDDPDSFGSGTVTPPAQSITGAAYVDADAFGSGSIDTSVTITGALYSDPDSFGSGLVTTTGPQSIVGSLYENLNGFGFGTISGGEELGPSYGFYQLPDAQLERELRRLRQERELVEDQIVDKIRVVEHAKPKAKRKPVKFTMSAAQRLRSEEAKRLLAELKGLEKQIQTAQATIAEVRDEQDVEVLLLG